MPQTLYVTNEKGQRKEITLTDEDSALALENDFKEIKRIVNPKYVTIQSQKAQPGEAMRLSVTVLAPSHYLTGPNDSTPKECDSMTVTIVCYPGYPKTPVMAFYAPDHYLASPNVFRSGRACIDDWRLFTSSMVTVVRKLLPDMIHDNTVNLYNSVANGAVVDWHMAGCASGRFPTMDPKLLFAQEAPSRPAGPPPLPPRRGSAVASGRAAPPPLPPRRH